MSLGPSLTPEQQAAVEAPDGAHLVVAPPGSGKTEVLIRRAVWLVDRSQGEPFAVLAITYTDRAAAELGERARATLGDESWRVHATTLHAFCLDMLQRYGEAVGILGDVTVLDSDRLRRLQLSAALAGVGASLGDAQLDELLARLDDLRERLMVPELAPDEVVTGTVTLREAYEAYEESLDDNQVIDFPGMLYRAWRLLREDEWVSFHYRRQYRHVLIDEAQDLARCHVEILRALCGKEARNVFIVADDDQEVYTFAGASSEYYAAFAEELGVQRHRLTVNFRCAARIVEAAERLRERLRSVTVTREPMATGTAAPGWIGVQAHRDPFEEANAVAEWIDTLLHDGLNADWVAEGEERSLRAEDVCVMARTRFGFDTLLESMRDRGIVFVLRTEEGGLFDSTAGQALYLSLRVLANPRDRASLQRLRDLTEEEQILTVAESAERYAAGEAEERLTTWLDRLEAPEALRATVVRSAANDVPWRELDRIVVPSAAPDGEHERAEREMWEADLDRLAMYWNRYAALSRVPELRLATFLREVSRAQRTPPDASGVRLLTPYRAKGLQFRVVVVVGLVEGTFPHYRATTGQAVELERRALYVAMTRASRAALLTYPLARRDRWGGVHRDPPSRFLAEAGLLP